MVAAARGRAILIVPWPIHGLESSWWPRPREGNIRKLQNAPVPTFRIRGQCTCSAGEHRRTVHQPFGGGLGRRVNTKKRNIAQPHGKDTEISHATMHKRQQHTTTLDAPAAISVFLAQVTPLRCVRALCLRLSLCGAGVQGFSDHLRPRLLSDLSATGRRSARRATAHLRCWPSITGSR
jgi:hypothetical protein